MGERKIIEDFEGLTLAQVLELDDSKSESYRIVIAIAGTPIAMKKKNSQEEYLDVPIGDVTCSVNMRVWDGVEKAKENFTPGSIWSLMVQKDSWMSKPQITFLKGDSRLVGRSFEELDSDVSEIASKKLRRAYPAPVNFLRKIIGVMERLDLFQESKIKYVLEKEIELKEHSEIRYSNIVRGVFGLRLNFEWHQLSSNLIAFESEETFVFSEDFKGYFQSEESYLNFCRYYQAPAAKSHHGNFIYGLSAHIHGQLDIIDSIELIAMRSRTFETFLIGKGSSRNDDELDLFGEPELKDKIALHEKIDFDLLRVAAIIHDYYKIFEYEWTPLGGIEYAQNPPLFYHDLLLFSQLSVIKSKFGVPVSETTVIDKLAEIIIMHHGQWAEYQPDKRRNHFPENDIFHLIDNMEAKITAAIERT